MTQSCRKAGVVLVWLLLLVHADSGVAADTVSLASLDLSQMSAGWGKPIANRSIQDRPISIAGRDFARGVGTHAASAMWIDLRGGSSRFTAWVGVDDEVAPSIGTVEFRVVADGEMLFRSGVMKTGDAAQRVDVDLTDRQTLLLVARSTGDGVDYAGSTAIPNSCWAVRSRNPSISSPVETARYGG